MRTSTLLRCGRHLYYFGYLLPTNKSGRLQQGSPPLQALSIGEWRHLVNTGAKKSKELLVYFIDCINKSIRYYTRFHDCSPLSCLLIQYTTEIPCCWNMGNSNIIWKFIFRLLSNLADADEETNKRANWSKNTTSLAKITNGREDWYVCIIIVHHQTTKKHFQFIVVMKTLLGVDFSTQRLSNDSWAISAKSKWISDSVVTNTTCKVFKYFAEYSINFSI